jgi:hypothetical protein
LAVDYDRDNNKVVNYFDRELNAPLPGLEMESQLGVKYARKGKQQNDYKISYAHGDAIV